MHFVPCQTSPCRADPGAGTRGPTYWCKGDREKMSVMPMKKSPLYDKRDSSDNVRNEACDIEVLVNCKVHDGIIPVSGQFAMSVAAVLDVR